MFFYWKTGPEGELWISRSALRDGLRGVLPPEFDCVDASFRGAGSELILALAARKPEDESRREYLVRDLQNFLRPLGIESVHVSWVKQPPLAGYPAIETILRDGLSSPVIWGLLLGVLAAVVQLGARGTFFSLLWGAAGFLVACLLLMGRVQKFFGFIRKRFGNRS